MKNGENVRTWKQKMWKKAGVLLILSLLLCAGFVAVCPIKAQAAGVVLKNTKGKDKKDVALIKALLEQQKKRGGDISAYLDLEYFVEGEEAVYEAGDISVAYAKGYVWEDGKLLGLGMYDFRGAVSVKGFKNLVGLWVRNGKLTGLRVSGCPNLLMLVCDGNKLAKLDLSNQKNLACLICNDNKLTKLDVSKLAKLDVLVCTGNKLTKLDVRKCTVLKHLKTDENVEILGWKS